jgi:hypothetical protein
VAPYARCLESLRSLALLLFCYAHSFFPSFNHALLQVMLLKNLDTAKGLVNGARGVVVEFRKPAQGVKSIFPKLPVVRFEVVMGDTKSEEVRLMTEEMFDIGSGTSGCVRISLLYCLLSIIIYYYYDYDDDDYYYYYYDYYPPLHFR